MSKAWLQPLATVTAAATILAFGTGVVAAAALGLVGGIAPAAAKSCAPHCPNPLPDPNLYVANNGSGTLTVIDAITDAVTATVDVGSGPTGVAVDPVSGIVYVTNTDSDSVSVVNATTDAVTATISLGYGTAPTGLAITPNGATAYVADSGTNTVSAIDLSTNAVTSIPARDDPTAVVVSPDGASVYVTDTLSEAVSVIATATNSVTATIKVQYFPSAVAVSPVGNDVYVTNECGQDEYCDSPGSLSVINPAKNTVTKTYPVGYAPVAVTITPNTDTLYVVNSCGPVITPPPKPLPPPDCGDDQGSDPANVTTFDTATMDVASDPRIGSAQPGLSEGAVSTPDGSSMFVANPCGADPTCGSVGTVSVFDIGTGPVATIAVGDDPLGLAISGPWDRQQNQTALSTSAGPAAASISPYVYFAETVSGSVMYEWYDTATHGWGATASVPGASTTLAPALTAVGSTLWVAWTTSSDTIEYNELNTTNNTWMFTSAGNIPPVPQAGTDEGPALATLGNTVYVAWKGHTTDGVFYITNDGSWSSQNSIPSQTTDATPAIAALPDSDILYFAWKSETTNQIFVDDDIGGTFGTAAVQPQAATNVGPALAVTPTGPYLMWKDATTNKLGYSLATPGGWTVQQFVPSALTSNQPALTALGANLFTAWQGHGNTSFWYDSID